MGVSLPELVDVSTNDCPELKYVFSPQEQQKQQQYFKSSYYKYHQPSNPIPLQKLHHPVYYTQPGVVLQPTVYQPNVIISAPYPYQQVQQVQPIQQVQQVQPIQQVQQVQPIQQVQHFQQVHQVQPIQSIQQVQQLPISLASSNSYPGQYTTTTANYHIQHTFSGNQFYYSVCFI